SASRRWSDSECVVLVALYMCSDFAIADDERAENALIASDLSRNPSSVDRQWRNIKDYLNRIEGKNISNTLKHFCDAAVEDVESVTGLSTETRGETFYSDHFHLIE
ncbi:hypothetical protein N9U42_03885, partial [Luminiphilus sp.]